MASLPSVLVGDECAFIPLTRGQVAIVDVGDYHWLSQWKWHAWWGKNTQSFYAQRTIWVDGKFHTISMHRLILGLERGDKRQGDHCNCNTLDNRRTNLRIATHGQNVRNSRLRSTNKSGFKGASVERPGVWRASISVNGRMRHLGFFSSPEMAHEAYRVAALEHYGEFARMA